MYLCKMNIILYMLILMQQSDALSETHFQNAILDQLYSHLHHGLNFMNEYYSQINLDGLLGVVFARAQLTELALVNVYDELLQSKLDILIIKCDKIRTKILPNLPNYPEKYFYFENILLNPYFWVTQEKFVQNSLSNLGIYKNWSVDYIIKNKEAVYNGTTTDVCLEEVLRNSLNNKYGNDCPISKLCENIMFGNRIDNGYLLTHRLFYLQIAIRSKCIKKTHTIQHLINNYCSLILKESKTNEYLNFPQHDIFIEQVVFCGMEGYDEFLSKPWMKKIINWQTTNGCYLLNVTNQNLLSPRSTNIIVFGCTDHTTGLGIAALAINFKYQLTASLGLF